MQATVKQLAQVDIFASLGAESLSNLASASWVKSYKQGEILIHEGDRFPSKLHAILSGSLLVQKVAASGKETNLRRLLAGQMFAAPALFGDGIAPATVIALKDSQIITLEKAALLALIQLEPEIALKILHCFNQRLQEMHQVIHGLISEKAIVRLVRLIHFQANQHGTKKTKEGACLNIKLPHQQMARMVGITYEECVRLISKDLSHIVTYARGGVITIQDVAALEAIMS